MQQVKSELRKRIDASIEIIRKHTQINPEIGIILGTGLGALAKEIETDAVIPYEDIPFFPLSTVEFHKGRLILGKMSGKNIVAMQGRFHYYEGYSMQDITYPVRVMKLLGVKQLLVSNACGSVNPEFRKGELMLIEDHINLLGGNPLIGPNDDSIGVRFPDMSQPYSQRLNKLVEQIASEQKIKVNKGVYASMTGPSLETRAEYKFLQIIGADVVGMSTVPEVIVANQMAMEVLGMSIITDECYPESLQPANIDDIIHTATIAEPNLTSIFKKLVGQI